MFVIYWDGHAIPSRSDYDKPDAYDRICEVAQDPMIRERLWDLWSCADALVVGDEDLFVADPIGELLNCLEDPNFQASGQRAAAATDDAWPGLALLPQWVRDAHAGLHLDLKITDAA